MFFKQSNYLNGQILLAMPTINDPRFDHAAIYICAHDENGAMGIVINHIFPGLEFGSLLKDLEIQSDIKLPQTLSHLPVLCGGPIETARGFLIHSSDFKQPDTIKVQSDIFVTGTVDALMALGKQTPPEKMIFALGYAGWQPGQLESEMRDNVWMSLEATSALVFEQNVQTIWKQGFQTLGINPSQLSSLTGSA
jgi:putative transcriptional regulator